MSPGSIILWIRKEKPSDGGGVDGSRRCTIIVPVIVSWYAAVARCSHI